MAARCTVVLNDTWSQVRSRTEVGDVSDYIQDEVLLGAIRRSLSEAANKSYRYVLVTELLAKIADPTLDCRCLQDAAPVPGAFDPRELCKKVIVPFERRELSGALGSSPDPFVSNPLRVNLLTKEGGASKKDRTTWDQLCDLTEAVEARQDPSFTELLLRQTLLEIYRKVAVTQIQYAVPLRVSLFQALSVVKKFCQEKSLGDRPLAVASALSYIVGKYFGIFSPEVKRGKITTSDQASEQVTDIECRQDADVIRLAVEVKDRAISVSDLEEKKVAARQKGVGEVLFVSTKDSTTPEIEEWIAKEFAAGQNIHTLNLFDLVESVLALAGEQARRDFLLRIGAELDQYSDTKHRLAWRDALAGLSTQI